MRAIPDSHRACTAPPSPCIPVCGLWCRRYPALACPALPRPFSPRCSRRASHLSPNLVQRASSAQLASAQRPSPLSLRPVHQVQFRVLTVFFFPRPSSPLAGQLANDRPTYLTGMSLTCLRCPKSQYSISSHSRISLPCLVTYRKGSDSLSPRADLLH